MDQLIKNIKKNTKPSYQARYDDNNKLEQNIANFGLQIDDRAIREGGEYNGIIISALEPIKPLLTDYRIIKAIEFIKEEKLFEASRVLNLNEVNTFGLDLIYYVIDRWLQNAGFDTPIEFRHKKTFKTTPELKLIDRWIDTTIADPVSGKFKIVDPGRSKQANGTVLPESWVGRIFNNAYDLHKEMDKLDWRAGKPSVNYCICYFISLHKSNTWIDNISEISNITPTLAITIEYKKNTLMTNIADIKNKKDYKIWKESIDKRLKLIVHTNYIDTRVEEIIIACDVDKIFNKDPIYIKTENAGVLVSRLQKCNRRGRGCANLLVDTIEKLNRCKPYNLPEQQFARVSGTKQIVWRLFITTIEDIAPYLSDNKYLSMVDLICLAIVTHADPNLQFNDTILNKIKYTALLSQRRDFEGSNLIWRDGDDVSYRLNKTDNPYSDIINSFKIALRGMPMMKGDRSMITKGIYEMEHNKNIPMITKLDVINESKLYDQRNKKLEFETILASYDMIACPYLLLMLQGSLPKLPDEKYSTHNLSSLIWDLSSGLNIRRTKLTIPSDYVDFMTYLHDIQYYLINKERYIENIQKSRLGKIIKKCILNNYRPTYLRETPIDKFDSRTGFILIFGREQKIKYQNRVYDVIICGDNERPCKIKKTSTEYKEFVEGDERFEIEKIFVESMNNNTKIKLPDPPVGHRWKIQGPNIAIRIELVKSNKDKYTNNLLFYVNDIELKPFDTTPILEKIRPTKSRPITDEIKNIVSVALYNRTMDIGAFEFNILMRLIGIERREKLDFAIYDWGRLKISVPGIVWRSILVKFNSEHDNKINIGPVDSYGNKIQYAIDYIHEGVYWRLFNMFTMLYPRTIINTSNDLIFSINKNTPEFQHLYDTVKRLASLQREEISLPFIMPKIKTQLWPHQRKTVTKIISGILKDGKMGFGDASHVGAGKTLSSLSIICHLMQHNIQNKLTDHYACTIMLPTSKLYETWETEIKKHTAGFDIVFQASDGKLSGNIKYNTILITTMGRIRDHPINIPWIYVCIDECLTVQNSNALHTMSAHRQTINSMYGVLLLSATFFRSRIDKLYYMLKMLRTGLPETREYLSAILSESIICNLPEKMRDWITNITRYKMNKDLQKSYDKLLNQKMDSERLFTILSKFIYDNVDYISFFEHKLRALEKQKRRVLIFAKSKQEADEISKRIHNVGRFPDISKNHVVGTVHECGFGVNTLVKYNCLLCRIVSPDVIPQIKGRLDRPNQKEDTLYIEFILLENTIEEANLIILEISNKFRKNFILPLADYYDLAVKKKQIQDIK